MFSLERLSAVAALQGVNTVLATLVGVVCFGSSLTAANAGGIGLAVAGTYLCVR